MEEAGDLLLPIKEGKFTKINSRNAGRRDTWHKTRENVERGHHAFQIGWTRYSGLRGSCVGLQNATKNNVEKKFDWTRGPVKNEVRPK